MVSSSAVLECRTLLFPNCYHGSTGISHISLYHRDVRGHGSISAGNDTRQRGYWGVTVIMATSEQKDRTYTTLDNGGRICDVHVSSDGHVVVYHRYLKEGLTKILDLYPKEVYIGRDPKCEDLDGSTVLLGLEDGAYIYIGGGRIDGWSRVVRFTPKAPIVRFEGLMGNSGCPIPYAMDSDGRAYMMWSNRIVDDIPEGRDPSKWYDWSESHGMSYRSIVPCRGPRKSWRGNDIMTVAIDGSPIPIEERDITVVLDKDMM